MLIVIWREVQSKTFDTFMADRLISVPVCNACFSESLLIFWYNLNIVPENCSALNTEHNNDSTKTQIKISKL